MLIAACAGGQDIAVAFSKARERDTTCELEAKALWQGQRLAFVFEEISSVKKTPPTVCLIFAKMPRLWLIWTTGI